MENPVARKISLAEEQLQDSGSTSKINVEVGVGGGVLVCGPALGSWRRQRVVVMSLRPWFFLLCMARQVCLLMMVVNKLVCLSLSQFHKLVCTPQQEEQVVNY